MITSNTSDAAGGFSRAGLSRRLVALALLGLAACGLLLAPGTAQPPAALPHPLDTLGKEEIAAAVAVLKAADRVAETTRFALIHLQEPSKAEVLAFRPASPPRREAFVSLYDWATNRTSEAVVDVRARRLVSWKDVPGAQPRMLSEDNLRTDAIVRADPRWQAAMQRRGIRDLNRVAVFGAPMGGYAPDPPTGATRRVVAVTYYREPLPFGGFVEGVLAHVDLTRRQVIRFEDSGVMAPQPPADALFDAGALGPARRAASPLRTGQPNGPTYQVQGHEVRWQNWRFRFGMHPREGLVLSTVSYEDQGRLRPILYRAALSEMVVPYGDPGWLVWNPLDAGWAGMGIYGRTPLNPPADAPERATFFSAVMHDESGDPVEVPRAIALYEREGGVLWRHAGESRPDQQLVLSSFAVIDNYDYGFNWIFHADGTLEVEVLLTGIMNYKTVARTRDAAGEHGESGMSGHLVAPNIEAPHHQHFLCFRLDLDVDGAGPNTVVEMNTAALPPGPMNPYLNGFTMKETPLRREQEAQRTLSMATSRRWKVLNPTVRHSLGQPSGYMLLPGENSVPFAPAQSYLRRYAGFVNAHLWVTPYQPEERYAAGDYVHTHQPGDGLPRWTSANRPLEERDVVLWYTLGVTHLPRLEEWPVMPVHRAGFKLVPAAFFSRNPALDLPKPE